MPVALISVKYLKEKFNEVDISSIYSEGTQSSFVLNGTIEVGEVKLFEWDINQRINIGNNKVKNNSEIERHRKWYKDFGVKYFCDDNGQIIDTKLPLIFTPSTVKLLSYYFSKYNIKNINDC
jgi:hypothetical protein